MGDREPVYDSEGLRIVTTPKDETEEDGRSLNSAAREAFEAEQAADEKQ